MERTDLKEEQFERLVEAIFPIVAESGPYHTTMDAVARKLSMSKRTLYEIFGSQDEMIISVMRHMKKTHSEGIDRIIRASTNVMEAMANVLIYHQQMMSRLSADFFRDMDARYHNLRKEFESDNCKWEEYISIAVKLGKQQGVFRTDTNYKVMFTLFRVQMESLKRMEEFFPPGITLLDAYNTISISFLRSIATEKGMKTLDQLTKKFNIRTDNEFREDIFNCSRGPADRDSCTGHGRFGRNRHPEAFTRGVRGHRPSGEPDRQGRQPRSEAHGLF